MENWCKLPYSVLKDKNLSVSEKVLYAVLLDISREREVKKSIKGLQDLTGLSPKTIQRAIKTLRENGYIVSAKSDGRSVCIKLISVLEEKKRKPEQEPPQPESSSSERSFENDLTEEEILRLETQLLEKTPNLENTKKVLRSFYTDMRTMSSKEVPREKVAAYIGAMIKNATLEDISSRDFDVNKYKFVINNF